MMFYRRRLGWLLGGLVCSCLIVMPDRLGADPGALAIGSYAMTDGQAVKIKSIVDGRATVIDALGNESVLGVAQIAKVTDFVAVGSRLADRTEAELLRATQGVGALRDTLGPEFDGAFLEMMTACLVSAEHTGYRENDLGSFLTARREDDLRSLVDGCKRFDVNAFIGILSRCDFQRGFSEYASAQTSAAIRQTEREIEWIETQSAVQSDDAKLASGRKIAEKRVSINDQSKQIDALARLKTATEVRRAKANLLQKEYFRVYEKAGDVLKQYVALREATARGESLGSHLSGVRMLAEDWASELVQPSTRESVTSAGLARVELGRRRNPAALSPSFGPADVAATDAPSPRPPQVTPPSPPKKQSQEQPQKQPEKKKGCFIATAVYGSYDHPDVKVFRGFRDNVLQQSSLGRQFIAWYYDHGPRWAEWLKEHEAVSALVRLTLTALAFVFRYPAHILCAALLVWHYRRVRKQDARRAQLAAKI